MDLAKEINKFNRAFKNIANGLDADIKANAAALQNSTQINEALETEITQLQKEVKRLSSFHEVTIPPQPPIEPQAVKAFPSAYGAGANATGGRGGEVYIVTNLNDSGNGSFRDAVNESNRIIIFNVSGTIHLTTSLYIRSKNLTIAGQSAPFGGVAITGKNLYLDTTSNIIMRYVRCRPLFNDAGNVDALNAYNLTNCIFDHCSISWGGDEAFSITGSSSNITVQNSILGESKTGMIAGNVSANDSDNFSIYNNLWYNISHRFPNISSGKNEVVNNIVHNWSSRLMVAPIFPNTKLNEINNFYQSGKNTYSPTAKLQGLNWLDIRNGNEKTGSQVYTNGNVYDGFVDEGDDNWKLWVYRFDNPFGKNGETPSLKYRSETPFKMNGVDIPTIGARKNLEFAHQKGANKSLNADGTFNVQRDNVDVRYIKNIINNTSEQYGYHQTDIASTASYKAYQNAVSNTPINTRPSNYDTSSDGIPDVWKQAKGFDANKDLSSYVWPSGYVGIEEFLNEIDN
ncbi:MAG: hypothetical protein ACPGRW_06110 [Flavobacteriaceae bacterium]